MNPLLLKNIREYLIQFMSWEDLLNIRLVDTAFHTLLNDRCYQPLIDQRFCTYMNKKVDEIGDLPRPRYCQNLNYYEVSLISAILSDKPAIVKYLIKWRGIDLLNLGAIDFYYAIYTNNLKILKVLLLWSNLNSVDNFVLILTYAAMLDRVDILRYLLHIDEDKSLSNPTMNIDWHTSDLKSDILSNTCVTWQRQGPQDTT